MKFFLIGLISVAAVHSCNVNNDKSKHTFSFKTECNLYVEVYAVGLLRNLSSHYVTDSVNFRLFVGTFDDEAGGYQYVCKGDSLIINTIINGSGNTKKVTKTSVFSISKLKKEKKLD